MHIAELTPHAPPMLLVDNLVETGEAHVVSETTVRADGLFDNGGFVSSYLGLEYMAQTVAAFSGYQAMLRDEGVKPGFLLGTRRFNTNISRFACGSKLTVTAVRSVQSESGLAAFECRVDGDGIEQTATLSVYEPPDTSKFVSGGR